jgi:hypothetical protein
MRLFTCIVLHDYVGGCASVCTPRSLLMAIIKYINSYALTALCQVRFFDISAAPAVRSLQVSKAPPCLSHPLPFWLT